MGVGTGIGLFLRSSMRMGLIIVAVFLINKVQQKFHELWEDPFLRGRK